MKIQRIENFGGQPPLPSIGAFVELGAEAGDGQGPHRLVRQLIDLRFPPGSAAGIEGHMETDGVSLDDKDPVLASVLYDLSQSAAMSASAVRVAQVPFS